MPRYLILVVLAAACVAGQAGQAGEAGEAGQAGQAVGSLPLVPLVPLQHAHHLVARELSGDSALRTVAFVEQFWRQPGSPGFDTSIARVAGILERAGYVREEGALAGAPLVYRIERRPLPRPAWTPLDASLAIEGGPELLRFATNRNMLAIGSYATPDTGVLAEVVDL